VSRDDGKWAGIFFEAVSPEPIPSNDSNAKRAITINRLTAMRFFIIASNYW
jgi:hypothetical protein